MTERILRAFSHMVHRNLLLLGVVCAIWMSMRHPLPGDFFGSFNVTTPLVGLIFLVEGMRMSFASAGGWRQYVKEIGWAVVITAVCYPLAAHVLAGLFGVQADARIGYLLLASLPGSSASMAMAAGAGGDPLTAMLLLITLGLAGIATIPADLGFWLGSSTPVSALMVLKDLVLFLFVPALAGQGLRRAFPRLERRAEPLARYVPMTCITLLVYVSCSREAALLHDLRLSDLAHVAAPCLLLHVLMLGLCWLVARRWLRMADAPARSFLFVVSEKPMSLSVALWSITYAAHHPLAIFPILVFYVGQVLFDSIVVSKFVAKDLRDNSAS